MEIGKITNLGKLMAVPSVSPLTPQERAQQRLLIRAVESVNSSHPFGQSTELTFAYDPHSRKTVLQIVDRNTKEVIRQLPAEELLRLARESEAE